MNGKGIPIAQFPLRFFRTSVPGLTTLAEGFAATFLERVDLSIAIGSVLRWYIELLETARLFMCVQDSVTRRLTL